MPLDAAPVDPASRGPVSAFEPPSSHGADDDDDHRTNASKELFGLKRRVVITGVGVRAPGGNGTRQF